MNRRRGSMMVKNNKLPSEYQEVEYLESRGQQIIYWECAVNELVNIDIDIELIAHLTAANNYLFGAAKTALINGGGYYPGTINYFNISSRFSSYIDVSEYYDIPKRYRIVGNGETNLLEITVDGIIKQAQQGTRQCISDLGIVSIFGYRNTDTSYPSAYKLYQAHIEIGDTNYNLIPCYRKSDSEPGVYDIINREFHTNKGSGTFIVGPDVN